MCDLRAHTVDWPGTSCRHCCCVTPDSAHLVRDEARAAAGERGDIERDMDRLLLLVRGEVKGETCSWTRSKSWEHRMVMDIGQGHVYAQGHCPQEKASASVQFIFL